MILVDTSVWIDHLRAGNPDLYDLLYNEQVLFHPFVIGELACGNLGNREEILTLLTALPQVKVAEHEEALQLLESKRLYGKGLGWTDVHLIASTLLAGCMLWTFDKSLRRAAKTLQISA